MSPDQELLNLAGAESESKTLFDELAGLVPAERQAEYYRVIAHTRTLSPDDEMLRVLEAMGTAEGNAGGLGPASNGQAVGRKPAAMFPAIRFAGDRRNAWPVLF